MRGVRGAAHHDMVRRRPVARHALRTNMIARRRRFAFTAWWRTVDKLMLAALLVVMLAGIVLSLAASPPVAARLGLDPFYFVNRHVLYLIPAIAVMLGTSLLSPRQIRRVALVVFAISFAM